jgi:aldehyde dehydrogenase
VTPATEQLVAAIVDEVLARLKAGPAREPVDGRRQSREAGRDGVFATVGAAVAAAREAQPRLAALDLTARGEVVGLIRRLCAEHAEEWGRLELEETRIGRLDHKIEKLRLIRHVLGVEALKTKVRSDATGTCLIEPAPWGVVAMALPATHSAPTLASNAINVLAAGNAAVFSPHPAGARIAARAVAAFNRAIRAAAGLENVLCTIEQPTIESTQELFRHPDVALICVTGGPAVVKAAMTTGKRVIAAGPGNPPVIVDETADLDHAAVCTVAGASFDNNLLCIGEKEVFVVERVAPGFLAALGKAGAVELEAAEIERLTRAAFTFDGDGGGCRQAHVSKDFVGRDAAVLARAAGRDVPAATPLLFGETAEDHPFVQVEQMMPFLPVVRVPCVDRAIEAAVRAEHGYRHTAIVHSRNPEVAARAARALDTTILVHNGSSVAALGHGSAGYHSHSIATPTGEGITTPMTFTRQRQITMVGPLRIY